jgi:multiple sugar transport system permease protein
MLSNFTLTELLIYAVVWGAAGGLPGFYTFALLNRNPRVGARWGVMAGAVVGLSVAALGVVTTAREALNLVLLLWAAIALTAFVFYFARVGWGNHNQNVTLRQNAADMAYGLLLPTFVIVIAIVVFPMIWNIVLSFRPIRIRDLPELRLFSLDGFGLENYDRVFGIRGFFDTLFRTFLYTIEGTLLAILLGLIAALIVKDSFRGRNLVRGFMLFPYIAPIVSVVLVWKLLLNAQYGLVNEAADALGFRRVDFLNTPGTAFTMVVLFQAWRYFPFAFLFILARIQAIPEDMYEAAKVDGAAPSQRLWYITLPQLRTVFGTLFLLRFIWTFNKFDDVYLLTGGTAQTKLITIEIYDQLFSSRNIGAASAVAVVLAVVLLIVVGIYFRWFLVEER